MIVSESIETVEDSYRDHAEFLGVWKSLQSFVLIFRLPITKGGREDFRQQDMLTDKAYANKLIKLIEDYELV